MTNLYVNPLPTDKNQNALQEFAAPVRAITSVMMIENDVVSSVLLLHPEATHVEVNAVGGPIAIRWVRSTETPTVSPRGSVIASGLGANFDHMIPANSYRRFAVPRETGGVGPGGVANAGIGSVYGLYHRLGHINGGNTPASILVVQY